VEFGERIWDLNKTNIYQHTPHSTMRLEREKKGGKQIRKAIIVQHCIILFLFGKNCPNID
jgi:hypothetical protein